MSDQPQASDLLVNISINDIEVDEEGRVTIKNPEVAERVKAAIAAAPALRSIGPDTGCTNSAANCGCKHKNTVADCGCKKPV